MVLTTDFAATVAAGELIVAPTLLPFETANIPRKNVVKNLLSPSDAVGLLARFDTLPVSFRWPRDLHRQA
ncbi:MAG: hypothetical protein QOF33_1996 [Thermomicrobiales bacterium]|jgi:hypothetical protein|nr:hypothetical protein [Thermomicrobiales bacterium]